MELRPYQQAAVAAIEEGWRGGSLRKSLLVLPTGCHAQGERLLLADGSSKAVEDITADDLLMGDDGSPRHILFIQKGAGNYYRVIPKKGDPFVVTGDHKLTLRMTNVKSKSKAKYPSQKKGGEIIDVTVLDYMKWSKYKKHIFKLVRSRTIEHFVNEDNNLPIDPYFLGIMLGDGGFSTGNINVTTMDDEVVECLKKQAAKMNLYLKTSPAGKATTYSFFSHGKHSKFVKDLKEMGLRGSKSHFKFVPQKYKTSNLKHRLEMIAGLLDSDGHLTANCFDFVSASKQLADDLVFMCRSVGLAAYVQKCQKSCNDFTGTYYRVFISGECEKIPTRVKHKQAAPRRQKKNVLVTGFKIEPAGAGPYYGFTVDEDNRYLLDDFTITHNCGKTVVFCTVARRLAGDGRVLILAHREELIEQAREKYYRITGEIAAKEKAGETCLGDPSPVVVGSVQTLQNKKRLSKFPANYFGTIIIDEAHHALAAGYQRVLEHFPRARVLGVTATPDRGDKRNLAEYFDGVAYEYSLKSAIADGYLCPIRALTAPLRLDVSNVKTSRSEFGSDFDRAELSAALEEYLPQIAQCIKENAGDRKTVVFLPLVSIAQQFQRECEAAGLEAREVNGESDDRAETLAWFDKAGPGSVLCNAMLLTEGWDCPSVDCVVVLRPSKVRALYCQMIGRGTRICPGKENLLILDFLWMSDKHDLCKPACLITDNEKAQHLIAQKSEDEQLDLMEAADEAEKEASEEAEEQRRQSLAKALEAARRRPKRLIDPLDYAAFVGESDAEPVFKWELLPATDKQKAFLGKQGIDTANLGRGRAQRIIDSIMRRWGKKLATVKQIRALERAGYKGVKDWPFDEASARIAELVQAGWNPRRLGKSPALYNLERAADALFS